MTTTSYSICAGVYFVEVGGQGIVMDVPRDRFFALSSNATTLLRSVSQPKSLDRSAGASAAASESLEARELRQLLNLGLIAPSFSTGAASGPADIVPATSVIDPTQSTGLVVSARALSHLLLARITRTRLARRRGFAAVLERIANLPVGEEGQIGQTIASGTVRMYTALRCARGHGRRDCLERSIDLTIALRRQRVNAKLCIAVTTFPFRSHAWVQMGSIVLNDRMDRIRQYVVVAQF